MRSDWNVALLLDVVVPSYARWALRGHIPSKFYLPSYAFHDIIPSAIRHPPFLLAPLVALAAPRHTPP